MNLLVLSDSHRNRQGIKRSVWVQMVLPASQRPDYILFFGDGLDGFEELSRYDLKGASLLAVRGNCDFFASQDTPDLREVVFANYRAVMMHGHKFSVKDGLDRAVAYAAQCGADLLLFGHTHEPFSRCYDAGETVGGVTIEKPLIAFNPGAVECGSFGVVTLSEKGILTSHGKI